MAMMVFQRIPRAKDFASRILPTLTNVNVNVNVNCPDKGHELCAGGQNKKIRLTIYCFRPAARRI